VKHCTKCKKSYPATTEHFYKHGQTKDGLRPQCKSCMIRQTVSQRNYDNVKRNMRKYHGTIRGYLTSLWHNIHTRCYNPKAINYERYGGRGIKCLFKTREEFIDYIINNLRFDTREKIGKLQIDRINNIGHYEEGNIQFVTRSENQLNKRKYKKRKIKFYT